jgi:hypothetical protein
MMKKALMLVLVAVLVFSQMSVFASATVTGTVYSDQTTIGEDKTVSEIQVELDAAGIQDILATDWFAGSVTVLIAEGLMTPDANGDFNPYSTLDAGTAVTVFAKILGIANMNDSQEVALQKAQDAGFVSDSVEVNDVYTRLDVAIMLADALGLTVNPVYTQVGFPFNEYATLTPWERGVLVAVYNQGIFAGYPDGSFRPDQPLTKAELAMLVDRILTQQA